MKTALFAVAGLAAVANADIIVSEILGSTGLDDAEFIELFNTGPNPVNILGYSIELWDSDAGGTFGGSDGASPITVTNNVTLQPGETYVFGNSIAADWYLNGENSSGSATWNGGGPGPTSFGGDPFKIDQTIGTNAIENGAYTLILTDAGGTVLESFLFQENGGTANRGGTPITPDFIVPGDLGGTVEDSGIARTGDGSTFVSLHFNTPGFSNPFLNDGTIRGGTPGVGIVDFEIPTPGVASVFGLAGLAAARRRRA